MGQLSIRGSAAVGDGGAAEDEVSSDRIGSGGSLGALEGSHIILPHVLHPTPTQKMLPCSHCHHISCTPQESEAIKPEASTPTVGGVELALEAPSSAIFQALEVAIPNPIAPLFLQLGGIKRVYKCWVEGCSEGPSTSHAAICAHMHRDHLEMRLACLSSAKTFLNSDALRHHRKIHSSQ